jgi:hypothetical protein
MIFNSHACTCALNGGARNRSGSMKTSAVAVRSVLRDGLEHPRRYQTARAGLATFMAVKLYRDGLDGRYKALRAFTPSLASAAPAAWAVGNARSGASSRLRQQPVSQPVC